MKVGVGVVVEVVVVSRADLGFKHIAPDTANSQRHTEVGGLYGPPVDRSDRCDML